jgi:hypothetical protein
MRTRDNIQLEQLNAESDSGVTNLSSSQVSAGSKTTR